MNETEQWEGISEAEVEEAEAEEDLTEEEFEQLDPLEQARHTLRVDENIDPLDALLSADKSGITDEYPIPRLKTKFVVRPIEDDREYDNLIERCTEWRKRRGGNRTRELDARRLARLVVADYCLKPAFSPKVDPASYQRLCKKYGTERNPDPEPEMLVAAALLPGEIDGLSDFILTLSGFSDEVVSAAGN